VRPYRFPSCCVSGVHDDATVLGGEQHRARSFSVFRFARRGRRVERRGRLAGLLRRPSCVESHKREWPSSRHSVASRRPRSGPRAHCRRTVPAPLGLVDSAALCVAAAYPAHCGHPPARLVSLIGHAIRLHGFFNHPFPRHGSSPRPIRRSRPGPMSSPAWTGTVVTHWPHSMRRREPHCRLSTQPKDLRVRRRSFAVTSSGWPRPPDMSMAIDRCRPDASAAAQLPTSSGAKLSPPVIVGTRSPTHWRTATTHNARHQRAPGISMPLRECAQSP
jgi:hypothetical protein